MNPDELRRALAGASPELKEALAQTLADTARTGAQVFLSAIELETGQGDGATFVLALATLTDAQRAAAWHAACDRVATER